MNVNVLEGNHPKSVDVSWGVKEAPAYFREDGREVGTNSRVLYREDNMEVLGVVGPRYKVVDHRPVIERAVQSLQRLGGDNLDIRHQLQGGRIFSDIVLRDDKFRQGEGNEVIFPKIRLVNSYDGSAVLNYMGGLFRLICTNGLMRILAASGYRRKHTLRVASLDAIQAWLDKVPDVSRHYFAMRERLIRLPSPSYRDMVEAKFPERVTKRVVEDHYPAERAISGENAWSMFQAWTRYTSHATRAVGTLDHWEGMATSHFLQLAGMQAA